MSGAKARAHALAAFYWAAVVCLLLPLCLIALMSLKDGTFVGFPVKGLTLRWYRLIADDREVFEAFLFSCAIAAASTSVALATGLWTACAIVSLENRLARAALICAACLPLVTPGIVSAIALRIFIAAIGLEPGFLAIALGHAVHSAPYVVLIVSLRLALMPRDLVQAAQSLGAGPGRAFLLVTLPWLRPALGAAALLALLESFDDFLRSFFLGGFQPTLPVLIYGRLFSGLSPEIGAVTTLVLLLSILIGLAAETLARRSKLLRRPSHSGSSAHVSDWRSTVN